MLRRLSAVTCSLLLALAATALPAQQHGMNMQERDSMPGMMGQQQMMMDGMMGDGMMGSGMMQMMGQGMGMMPTGGPGPQMILRMEESLGLTDEQVTRLEEIRDEFSGAQRQHMTAAMSAHQEARQAVQGDAPDFDAYEEALGHASEHMVQGHLAMARAAAESRDVLTEEQRTRLQEGMGMMQGMMGGSGMGDGMMQGRGQGRGAPR